MATFTVSYTFNKVTYTAIETTNKSIARSLFNRLKALGMSPVCKWVNHNSGVTHIIE